MVSASLKITILILAACTGHLHLILACLALLCTISGVFSTLLSERYQLTLSGWSVECFQSLAMIYGYGLAISSGSFLAPALPGMFLYISRVLVPSFKPMQHLWVALIPIVAAASQLNDSDVLIICITTLAAFIPTPSIQRIPSKIRHRGMAAGIVAIALLALLLPLLHEQQHSKTAIIRSGEWANAEGKAEFPSDLTQQISYGYSSLRSLLTAEVIDLSQLNDSFAEAWLITPTKPFTSEEVQVLQGWVKNGGHLIAVSDHTDLFGHARVLNKVLDPFGISTSLTAFFPTGGGAGLASNGFSSSANVKTSNTQSSWFAMPLLSDRCWEEDADYSSPNFFGELSPSIDDNHGRHVLSARTSYGSGTVTIHGDSTVFANFAIFQPGTPELIQLLRSTGWSHHTWPIIPWFFLAAALTYCLSGSVQILCLVSALCIVTVFDRPLTPLNWGESIFVGGNRELVMESGIDASSRFSTAYCVLGLSSVKPRWTDEPKSDFGIWFGDGAAPKGWKQVTTFDFKGDRGLNKEELEPLYKHVTAHNPYDSKVPTGSKVNAGQLWTDDVMGDWWFDRGISASKKVRFESWLAWIHGKTGASVPPTHHVWDFGTKQNYWLVLASGEEIAVNLPRIVGLEGTMANIGRGITVEIVRQEGKLVMLGGASMSESWGAPYSWVLVPQQEPSGN